MLPARVDRFCNEEVPRGGVLPPFLLLGHELERLGVKLVPDVLDRLGVGQQPGHKGIRGRLTVREQVIQVLLLLDVYNYPRPEHRMFIKGALPCHHGAVPQAVGGGEVN